MRQDFVAYKASWRQCLSELPACDVTRLADSRVGPQLEFASNLAATWNTNGYQARGIDQLTSTILGVSVAPDGTTATVVECEHDGVVIVKPATADGTGEQIINDEFVSSQVSWLVVRGSDGRWRAQESTVIQSAVGEDPVVCDADA